MGCSGTGRTGRAGGELGRLWTDGRILDGSASPLPSATGNPNTRGLWWDHGDTYTLTIERAAEGGWIGAVGGVQVRTLAAGGDRLDALMVWSEVFAPATRPR